MGPQRNFNDQGSVPSVSKKANSLAENPSAARKVTNVTVMNPYGIPCATYSAHSVTTLDL